MLLFLLLVLLGDEPHHCAHHGPYLSDDHVSLLTTHLPGQVYLSRGCQATEIRLVCPPHQLLVIQAAQFTLARQPQLNCSSLTRHSQPTHMAGVEQVDRGRNIRQDLNRRCSGYSSGEECRFSLLLDVPESLSWGEGWVEVWHRCVDQDKITTKCGEVELVEPGYIMSQAYPKYYKGGASCSWHISGVPGQVLVIIVLDLQLDNHSSVTINNDTVLLDRQVLYTSPSNIATIVFSTPHYSTVYPYRGLLLQIIPVLCTPVLYSNQVYIVHSNTTHATYQCSHHHVFSTTLTPTITLLCIGHSYHSPLPPCIPHTNYSVTHALHSKNNSLAQPLPSLWVEAVFLPMVLSISTIVLSLTGLILLLLLHNHATTTNTSTHQQQQQQQVCKEFF